VYSNSMCIELVEINFVNLGNGSLSMSQSECSLHPTCESRLG
jgi:hypothetical protein